ncbi:uncharacterized oxidoreductase YqjQ [Arthrobacter sp. Hiyo6]|nr:uncharacterized oxidoreductase YqjQ [Arthrobacter sp. Hiyo6]
MATWLITGCSTGLGRALAQAVLAHGHNAVVTARNAATLQEIADDFPDTALALPLDVTDREQISSVIEQARTRFGAIDVLVNNAGYGYRAAVEEADDADVRLLFDTNVFGAVDMIKAVLPDMRANRAGHILNISSIGARIKPAGSGYYSATKAALEGLSGSLQKEVQPLGINVTVVEPGAFRTDFAGRSLTQSATRSATMRKRRGNGARSTTPSPAASLATPQRPPKPSWRSSKARTRRSWRSSAKTLAMPLPPSPRQNAPNWTHGGTSASAPGSRAEEWNTPVWAVRPVSRIAPGMLGVQRLTPLDDDQELAIMDCGVPQFSGVCTTRTGQWAWATQAELTEPSSSPPNPPCPDGPERACPRSCWPRGAWAWGALEPAWTRHSPEFRVRMPWPRFP